MEWEPQHLSAPSTPNSFSSQSTGNSNPQRSDKTPILKQLSPSPSVTALSKLSNDDLGRKAKDELVGMLRRIEADYKNMLGEHGNVVKDVNRRYQIFVLESRNLKEVNQKLQDDNQELRDLCCFLDDDRQRGRKLAREWQRFGRYTASVMRSEVAVYQEKLRELEKRQSELVTENMELKELCLFLDQERTRITGDRDEGDGSSNGTTTGQEDGIISSETTGPDGPTLTNTPLGSSNYLRELELKVQKLEEEKDVLAQRLNTHRAQQGLDGSHLVSNDSTLIQDNGTTSGIRDESLHGSGSGLTSMNKPLDANKPDAVVHAMKVLQVHEELEKIPSHDENWDDTEKAILREMCNVVWRKLGDVGDVGSFNESSDSILNPPPNVPHSGLVPGMQGQALSFNLQQPQPQMASTPLSATTKVSSSTHSTDPASHPLANQKQPDSQSHLPPSNHPPNTNTTQYQTQPKKPWLPQTDQRIDMFSSGAKDEITANARPLSPQKRQEIDKVVHDNYERQSKPNQPPSSQSMSYPYQPSHHQEFHPHSAPTKQFQYSEDEKIPPHFLPHRRQQVMQYPGPPQQTMQYTVPQHQRPQTKSAQPHHQPHSHFQGKTFMSANTNNSDQPSHVSRSSSSSSALVTVPPYNSNPSHQHQQQPLTSSQQYPHHPVRLLDAPGLHHQNTKHEPRTTVSRDDNYTSQQLQKPNVHHPQLMYQRRDDSNSRSEPNVSQSVTGNLNQNRGAKPMVEAGHGQRQEHFSNPHAHGRFASDSSQGHQGSSLPSSRSNQIHHQDCLPSHSHATSGSIPSGYSAYPPTIASKSQHPPTRVPQPTPRTPVMTRVQPRRVNVGGGKVKQRNTSNLNHYDDYDSDSL